MSEGAISKGLALGDCDVSLQRHERWCNPLDGKGHSIGTLCGLVTRVESFKVDVLQLNVQVFDVEIIRWSALSHV